MASTFSGVIDQFVKPEAIKQLDTVAEKVSANIKLFNDLIAVIPKLNTEITNNGKAFTDFTNAQKKMSEVQGGLSTAQASVIDGMKEYRQGVNDIVTDIKSQTGATDSQAKALVALRVELSKVKDAVSIYQKLISEVNKENPIQLSDKAFTEVRDKLGSATADTVKAAFESVDPATKEQFIEQLKNSLAELVPVQKSLETQIRATNLELNRQATVAQFGDDSIKGMQAALDSLRGQYVLLSEAERATPFGEALKGAIDVLAPRVRGLKSDIGDFSQNVGNYAGSLNPLFEQLANRLKEVKNLLAIANNLTRSGGGGKGPLETEFGTTPRLSPEAVNQLKQEQEALTHILDSSATGFATARAEASAFTNALLELEKAGLKDTEAYKLIQGELVKTTKEVRETHAEIKAMGSDTIGLDRLIGLTRGLAGIYETAAASAELFGGDNKKVEESIKNLIAVQNILNGLQEIQKQLTERGTILNKLYAFSQLQVKTAMDSTATSSARLKAALITTGIGALVLLLGYLVLKLTATNDVLKESTGISQKTKDALAEYGKTIQEITDGVLKDLTGDVKAFNDAIGKSPTNIEKARAALKLLQEERDNKLNNGFDLSDAFSVGEIVVDNLRNQEKLKTAISAAEAAIRAKKEEQLLEGTTKKYQEASRIESQLIVDKNNRILATESSTYSQRLAALQSNLTNQKNLIQVQLLQDLTADNASKDRDPANRIIIQNKANADLLKVDRDFQDSLRKLNKDAETVRLTDLKAAFDVEQALRKQRIDQNKAIADNDKLGLEDRFAAATKFYQDSKLLVESDRDFQIKTLVKGAADRGLSEKQVAKQIELIRTNANLQLEKNDKELWDELNKISEDGLAKLAKTIQADAANKTNAAKDDNQAAKDALLDRLVARKITVQKYNEDIDRLNDAFSIEQTERDIDEKKKQISLYAGSADEQAKLAQDLHDLEIKYSNEVAAVKLKNLEKEEQKRKEVADKQVSTGKEVFDAVKTIASNQYSSQNELLQKQVDDIEKKKQAAIDAENASTDSAQDKANKIAAIEFNAQQEKEVLEARQRDNDLKRARFEQQAAIAEVIQKTAIAIAGDLKGEKKYLIPYDIATGAAQLAAILAVPLPKFLHGKDNDDYEGYANVSEDGRPELYISPSGRMHWTPPKPSVMWVEKNSRIMPHERAMHYVHRQMAANVVGAQSIIDGTDNSELKDAIDNNTRETRRAIEKNRAIQNVQVNVNLGFINYIQNSVYK